METPTQSKVKNKLSEVLEYIDIIMAAELSDMTYHNSLSDE
jgi:hypothetical protein